MSLSSQEAWNATKERFPVGSVVECSVSKRAVFGIFVRLPDDAIGQIEAPELSDNKSVGVDGFPNVGTLVLAKVLGFKDSSCQVVLTMKI